MNQLTIEHLAPYLPHGLEIKVGQVSTATMTLDETSAKLIRATSVLSVEAYQPILRPLSDLTKEINHRGDKFAPVDRMYAIASSETERSFVNVLLHLKRYESDDIDKIHKDIFSRAPYSMHCYACEHHFDVFGLIPAGLAISVHNLTENPYEK